MNKKVKEALLDIMADRPNVVKEEVIELIKTYDDAIDVEALMNKEYSARATRLMTTFRDEKGVRDVFTIKNNEDASEFVNISRSKEIDDLYKVKDRLDSNIKGNQKSFYKVERRLFLLENQISMADLNSEVK